MRDLFTFQEVDASQKATIRRYLRQRLRRFERLLRNFEDEARLHVTVRGPEQANRGFEVRGILRLTSGTLVSETEEHPAVEPALSNLAEDLLGKLRSHRRALRRTRLRARKERRQQDLSSIAPLLAKDAERDRREEFFLLLRPEADHLRRVARREIRLLERSGDLRRNQVSPAEVVDETVLRAWGLFSRRPGDLSLDDWLHRLLHKVLQDAAALARQSEEPEVTLPTRSEHEEELGDLDSDQWWWTQLYEEDEPLIWEDFLPEKKVQEPLEELSVAEERDAIIEALAELPVTDRMAFTLHELDGYDIEEICRIQDRTGEGVEASVTRVREHLLEKLNA